MSVLEDRYRRLIALYPAAHRRRYQGEMLSTLMDGAGENQRAPRVRETVDLVWNAIWLRLNRDGGPPARDPRWAEAAAVFGPLGAMVIAGLHMMVPLGLVGWHQRLAGVRSPFQEVTWVPFVQGAAWLLVAVTAVLGLRRPAAALGWTAVLLTVAFVLREYAVDPAVVVKEWTLIVFGVVVAGCLTLAKGPMALRARHVALFGGVSAACAVSLWVDAMIAKVEIHADWGGYSVDNWGLNNPSVPGVDTVGALPHLLFLLFLVAAALVQYKVDRGTRRRLRAFVWVPLVTYALVRMTYPFYVLNSQRTWEVKVPLTIGQWAALILLPLVIFGIAVIVVRRKDTQQRLIEIGRAHSS